MMSGLPALFTVFEMDALNLRTGLGVRVSFGSNGSLRAARAIEYCGDDWCFDKGRLGDGDSER